MRYMRGLIWGLVLSMAATGAMAVTPTKVNLSGPGSVDADAVSTAFTLESQAETGDPANVEADTVFDLSSDTSGTAVFYSDSGGTSPITQVTIATGASQAVFYYNGCSRAKTLKTPSMIDHKVLLLL